MFERKMTRAGFLRLAAAGGIGLGASRLLPAFGAATKESASSKSIEELVAGTMVIDGAVLPHRKIAGSWPKFPGYNKQRTGINAGAWTVGYVRDLPNLNPLIQRHADAVMRIDEASDLNVAFETGRFGMIFYCQRGFRLKGSVEPLAQWREQGLRILQIAYDERNELGGGYDGDAPLTPLGKKAVAELNRLGMVINVSQCGKRTTLDVAKTSGQPITANHANAERLTSHPRNKTDKELKAIAATGGVIGASIAGRFLRRGGRDGAGIEDFIAHVDHMVQLVGINHVGFATDGWIDGAQKYSYDATDIYLNSYERWIHVARRLREKGYRDGDLQKLLGLNFLRVYRQVLG